jgi:hypothetical protein
LTSARNLGASSDERARIEAADADAIEVGEMDWKKLRSVDFELDPRLIEQIRARRSLRQITLRVGAEQIVEARWVS